MSVASTAVHPLASYRAEFPIFERATYLNTCSLGALSTRSRRRVEGFLDEWQARGAPAWYDVWWEALADLRARYARLIGARSTEVALHASVSTATGVLAGALDYAARPKIVTTSLDFPTVAYQWLGRRAQGLEVEIVQSPDGVRVPVELIADAVDERTALVATSHVYFATGWTQDLSAIARIAHDCGALCFVDAYQSVGQVPLDVHETGVDFLCSGGLKWLLGGPGIVFLYVRDELTQRFEPSVTGWFAHARQFDFDPHAMTWHDDARRFEQGTPALAAIHAQLGGLEIIEEIGVPRIAQVTHDLTEDLIAKARGAGLVPRVAPDPSERSAIVMIPREDPTATVQRLAAAGIVVDARPGHVRISPFFYNVPDDHDKAIAVLKE
jgi:selenocysteine lyase/cysteine desulfurase